MFKTEAQYDEALSQLLQLHGLLEELKYGWGEKNERKRIQFQCEYEKLQDLLKDL